MARRTVLIACFLMTSLASVGLGSQEYDRSGHIVQFGDCMEFWPLHPAGVRGAVRSLPGGSYSPFVVYQAIGDSTAFDTKCGVKT